MAAFRRAFGRAPEGIAEAPGRVNLIGEHVDYNDGLVLPFAIDRSVICAWAPGATGAVRAHSLEFGETAAIALDEPEAPPGGWAAYVRGVACALRDARHSVRPLDLAVAGDVPQGAGLSSSAALAVAVAGAFREAGRLDLDDVALALLCQRAENAYVGVQCGIMDQFASALCRAGHALLIDCRTLVHDQIPLRLARAGLAVAIVNSGVSRELASSAYNERRRECVEAVAELRARLGRPELASLRDVRAEEMARVDVDSTPLRRARHVVGEIARVREGVEALRADDFAAFGRLMRASHASLRDDYAVSSAELDLLVELADARDYVLGSRLTGAGFGGCTVSLLRAEAVAAFEREVVAAYAERTGRSPALYITAPCDGLRAYRV
ncbi:MAG TPA: galactokinase [Dehalococcoidia bacterium]|nr:galactokinase [Dehalococcoidia bacterium]